MKSIRNIWIDKNTYVIYYDHIDIKDTFLTVTISDLDIDCVYFILKQTFGANSSGWILPLSPRLIEVLKQSKKFRGFNLKVYNQENRLIQYENLIINRSSNSLKEKYFSDRFDSSGDSFVDFFHGTLCHEMDTTGVVIDAGANVGFFTLYAIRNGAKRIYSIEPDPQPYSHLVNNYKKNNNIITINKVLNVDNKSTILNLSKTSSVASSIVYEHDTIEKIEIESICISDILKFETEINLFKLDIEGLEFDILRNMTDDQFNKINQFFIEYHDFPTELKIILENKNYNVEFRQSSESTKVGFIYARKK